MSTQSPPRLELKGFDFAEIFLPDALKRLDQQFLDYLQRYHSDWHTALLSYRQQSGKALSAPEVSGLLIACAPVLGNFIAELFGIAEETEQAQLATCEHQPIFEFKEYYVHKQAKRRVGEAENLPAFGELDRWLDEMSVMLPPPSPYGHFPPQGGEGGRRRPRADSGSIWDETPGRS